MGKYLTDTTGAGESGFIPAMLDQPRHNCDGVGGMHVYMPWWLDNKNLDFPRGYHYEIGGRFNMPGAGLGLGCTLGAFYSAIPSLALNGWIFGAAMAVGALGGAQIVRRLA